MPFLKRKWVLFSAIGLLLIIGITLGGLYAYSNQATLPQGLVLQDWPVGGKTENEFNQEWEKRKVQILSKPIQFTQNSGEPITLTLNQLPVNLNDQAARELLTYGHEGTFLQRAWKRWNTRQGVHYAVSLDWDEQSLKKMLEQTWSELLHHEPKDAKRIITDKDEIQYEPDQSAANLDIDQLAQKLTALTPAQIISTDNLTLPLPMVETKAKVTLESLKREGIERKIAEFSTNYVSNAGGRTHNVEATAKMLNNTLLKPDEIFDYSKIISETEKKYGYQPAPEIVQGQLQMGIGGGICQVSSTLYNTVLLSNLDVVERRNHSIPVGYIPMGRDATYSDDAINFRFKNSTGKDLLIQTSANDGLLIVKMFGTAPANREIEITSQTVSVLNPTVQTITDSTLATGDRKVVKQGRTGYKVQVFKTIKENGQIKEKVLVSTDIYRPQATVVHVGKKA
jgi:vancomycin resistance protein YoaR